MKQQPTHIPETDSAIEQKSFAISAQQKALVEKEFEKIDADPNYLLEWDEVKDQFKID
ncbi:MAG: hypothetical protein V4649_14925 [Bacteroidota bacterium]